MGAYEERIGNPAFEHRVRRAREVDAAFASRVRQAREEQGMSQAMLANKLRDYGIHIDGTAITRIEKNATNDSGARSIRLAEAVAISDALGKPLDEMLRTSPQLSDQMRIVRDQLAEATEAAEYARMRQAELHSKLRHLEHQQDVLDRLREAHVRLERARTWESAAQTDMDSALNTFMAIREITKDQQELEEAEKVLMRTEQQYADANIATQKASKEVRELQTQLDLGR